ncbi:MAG: winged helix-turn-helix transcriptional regulator [Schwartzia sp.]|nr:winged helix-turn-helix transcriptional regulator [Schwartzia sp. (in: firmicutes)]MBR1885841.1 winged helix-turn-helix transcriptional regulator [Schwartzia sp. (in: firmicutes)]
MEPINISYDEEEVKKAIANALENFYNSLLSKLDAIDLKTIMKSKNPYLYRAKSMQTSADIIESILQAFVSSSEETIFGNCFFEPIAIAACRGTKSATRGVDIELHDTTDNIKYFVAVKSGTSIFNADSMKKQGENFEEAQRTLRTSGGRIGFSAIVGYAYGTKTETGRGKAKIYEEVAGEEFWEALTGDKDFYTKIISYMGTLPEQYIEDYRTAYNKASNRLIRDFSIEFCNSDGTINWEKLVDYNSGSPSRKAREALECDSRIIINEIQKNPNINKATLQENCNLSDSRIKKILAYLVESGYLLQERNGNKIHWKILRPME